MAALKNFSRVAGVGMIIVLLAGLMFTAAAVKALSAPEVTVDNPQPGQESAYTIRFDIEQQLTMTHQIVVTFPFGTVLSNPVASIQASYGWVNGNYAPASFNDVEISSNPSTRTITVTMGQTDHVGESAQVLITVSSGITNPSAEGGYSLTVQTTMETNPVSSNIYYIPPTSEFPVAAAVVTVQNNAPGAASSYGVAFQMNHELQQSQTITVTFPQGTVVGASPVATIQAGAGWIDGTYQNSTVTSVTLTGDPLSRTVTATLGTGDAIGENASVNITISSGIINPASSGSYTLSVITSEMQTPVVSNPYAIGTIVQTGAASVIVANPEPGQESSYSIWYDNDLQMGPSDTITLTFPDGTVLTNPAGTVTASAGWINQSYTSAVINGAVFSSDPVNRQFTITLGTGDQIGEGATVLITIPSGITNPSVSGNYTLLVTTSQEPTPKITNPYSIPASVVPTPGVTSASVALNNYQISYSASYVVRFDVLSELGVSDELIITFPTGTYVGTPSATIQASDGWVGGEWSTAVLSGVNFSSDPQNRTVAVTLGSGDQLGQNAQVRIEIASGITNPPDLGDYELTVHTSNNILPVPSNTYTIVEPVPDKLPGIVSLCNPSGILINNWTGPEAIQQALNAVSVANSIIKIGAGYYNENVMLDTVNVRFQPALGTNPDQIFITGTWDISVNSTFPTVVQGFTLDPPIPGTNVLNITGGPVIIEDCVILKAPAPVPADEDLVIVETDNVVFRDCVIDTTLGDAFDVGIQVMVGTVNVTGCQFLLDQSLLSVNDKGIAVSGAGTVLASNCTFTGNSGLGIDFGYGNGLVEESLFTNLNKGISLASNGKVTIDRNELYDNNIGIYFDDAGNTTITNNVIAGSTWSAVDITGNSDDIRIVNNTIVDNAPYGVRCDTLKNNIVTNCILWGNSDDIINCAATYSDISDGDTGQGNISLDPEFIDPEHGNYHLKSISPCIDTGLNTAVTSSVDLDGNPRIVDGDGNGTIVVDMGAFEVAGPGVCSVAPLNYHGVILGQSLNLNTMFVNNTDSPVTVTAVDRIAGSTQFSYTSPNVPFTVNAGETLPVVVRFAPTVEGSANATFRFTTNSPVSPQVMLDVSGYGVMLLYNPGGGIPGDANGDGHIDVLDITKIIRIILGFE